jgi:hypothetical protein
VVGACGYGATQAERSANSDSYFVELRPPSTTLVCPLMKLPLVEHRRATTLAMSSTVPKRWLGVISTFISRAPVERDRGKAHLVAHQPISFTSPHRKMPCRQLPPDLAARHPQDGHRREVLFANSSSDCARARCGRSSIAPLCPIVPAPGFAAKRSTTSCAAPNSSALGVNA